MTQARLFFVVLIVGWAFTSLVSPPARADKNSVATTAVTAAPADKSPTQSATQATPDPDPERFAAAIRKFEAWDHENVYPHDAILFVGSSSINNWQTADAFPGLPVLNRGFGGSQISDVNHYFDEVVVKYRPKVIVFYCGDNDTQAGKSPEQIFTDFSQFLAAVHEKLPDTRVIYLPIKPSIDRWNKWPQMQATNALVSGLDGKDERLEIVDTATPLLGPDGKPRKELFVDDGLHLNPKGYAVWNEILTPVLKRAVAARL